MNNLSLEEFYRSLEVPLPKSMEFVPNAGVQMGQLEKENQFLTIALVGLVVVAGAALIYFVFESKRKEIRRLII